MPSDPHHNIFVVTGKVHAGKTTFVSNLVERLRENKVSIAGILSKGAFSKGERSEFTLIDLETGLHLPLASIEPKQGWTRFRKFYFDPQALRMGEKIVEAALGKDPDLIVIDEVGPMELQGQGWSDILELLDGEYGTNQLWVVRDRVLQEVLERWNIPEENVYMAEESQAEKLSNRLLDHC